MDSLPVDVIYIDDNKDKVFVSTYILISTRSLSMEQQISMLYL